MTAMRSMNAVRSTGARCRRRLTSRSDVMRAQRRNGAPTPPLVAAPRGGRCSGPAKPDPRKVLGLGFGGPASRLQRAPLPVRGTDAALAGEGVQ
jgi:hypothetical protein